MEPTPSASTLLEEGAIALGTVTSLTPSAALVSFGWKVEGRLPLSDLGPPVSRPTLKIGDRLEVFVESLGDAPESVVLSQDKALKLRTWDAVIARCAPGAVVDGTIIGRVAGGYTVDVGLTAFLPNSHAGTRRGGDDALVGSTLRFTVIELDAKRPKIVVSRKALAEEELQAQRAALAARLTEGAVLTGVVKTIADYGAFVDLGGIDGLIHVSEMSWKHVDHPRQVVRIGQEVKVKLLKYDAAAGKVALGLKQLQENPWAKIEDRFPVGSTVEGKVTGLAEFGAFVALADGVEGLVHISEMSWTKKVKHPSEVLKEGELVKVVVLLVDPEAHRLSLGLRQLQPNPWSVIAEKYPEGRRVTGKVRGITDFGVFVELEEGIEGLVHISELSWTEKVKHPGDHFKVGDSVTAQVLKVDVEDQRMALGVKQLEASPWQTFALEHPVGNRLKGRVTRVVDFGAFVEVAPGIEGLVHVSELREERVERPADVVKVGQEIEVQVVELDQGRRKVGLSVKALTAISREEYEKHLGAAPVKTTLGDLFKDQLTKK